MLAGAGKLGGMAAGWLMEFLALPDYDLGNKLGYLAGMILLEALIAYFTAGGYLVIKEGASIGARLLAYFLRFLDMGGAILGILGKGLGKLRRPIMGGLDAAGGFLSRFKFLDKVIGPGAWGGGLAVQLRRRDRACGRPCPSWPGRRCGGARRHGAGRRCGRRRGARRGRGSGTVAEGRGRCADRPGPRGGRRARKRP